MKNQRLLRASAIAALMLASATFTGCGDDTDSSCEDVDNNGVCDIDECVDADDNGICDDEEECVDANDNDICDDEEEECVDANDNDICDDEEEEECEADIDNDGICDDVDDCIDVDNDGICDDEDDCIDVDNDGLCDDDPNDTCVGDDESGDSDGDGVCDDMDMCEGDDESGDSDGDGVCDDIDACEGDDATGDDDGDGFCADVDCNDNDALIYPGAQELCGYGADNDCDPQTTKEGLATVRTTGGQWTDVTDIFEAGDVEVYNPAEDNETIYLCGGDFHARVVTGYSVGIFGHSGVNTLSAEGENLPVVEVNPAIISSPEATLEVFDVELRHSDDASGSTNAVGISVFDSNVILSNVDLVNNYGIAAGGLYASDSSISLSGEVDFRENYGFSGAAMTLRNSSLNTRAGTYGFYNNISAEDEAAIDLSGSEFIITGPAEPIVYFAGNVDDDGAGHIADIRMDNESTVNIGTAYFQPQDACTEDNVTVIGVDGYCYEGSSSVDDLTCGLTGCTPTP